MAATLVISASLTSARLFPGMQLGAGRVYRARGVGQLAFLRRSLGEVLLLDVVGEVRERGRGSPAADVIEDLARRPDPPQRWLWEHRRGDLAVHREDALAHRQ